MPSFLCCGRKSDVVANRKPLSGDQSALLLDNRSDGGEYARKRPNTGSKFASMFARTSPTVPVSEEDEDDYEPPRFHMERLDGIAESSRKEDDDDDLFAALSSADGNDFVFGVQSDNPKKDERASDAGNDSQRPSAEPAPVKTLPRPSNPDALDKLTLNDAGIQQNTSSTVDSAADAAHERGERRKHSNRKAPRRQSSKRSNSKHPSRASRSPNRKTRSSSQRRKTRPEHPNSHPRSHSRSKGSASRSVASRQRSNQRSRDNARSSSSTD